MKGRFRPFFMPKIMENWFESWFDTKYYHILYKNRDYSEAQIFIDNLLDYLKPDLDSKLLDLACGKGRHSVFLNKKGYEVTGVDLSEQSIQYATQFKNDSLNFQTHDMRLAYKANHFDYVFNLFTSFGYFESFQEDLDVIQSMNSNLKNNGVLVLDYLNPIKAVSSLVAYEEKLIEGINFKITKKIEDGFIVKSIHFTDEFKDFKFKEKVKLIDQNTFIEMFNSSGFQIVKTFGDYNLDEYQSNSSDRLILIGQKKEA